MPYIEESALKGRQMRKLPKSNDRSAPLWGLWHYGHIYIHGALSKNEIILTLIHEISHAFFYRKIKHGAIHDLEKILFKKFTNEQKEFLYKHVPEGILQTKSGYIRWTGEKVRLKLK